MSISPAAGHLDAQGRAAAHQAETARAFATARRHSTRVRRLRFGLVAGVFAVVAVLAVNFVLRTFRVLPSGLSLGEIAIHGARITMNAPRLTGSRRDGEGYVITAAKAEQDVTHPTGVDLSLVEGDITTADHDILHVVASSGHYESDREALELGGGVNLSTRRYRVQLSSAHIDFKAGVYASEQPVSVHADPDTTIVADSIAVRDNGALVQFAGHVRTTIHAATKDGAGSDREPGSPP